MPRPLATLALAGVLMAAALPSPCRAAGEANLGWNDCVSGGGLSDLVNDCTINTGFLSLIVSFRPPVQLDSMVGMYGKIVLITDQILPPWWHMETSPTAGCRAHAMNSSFDFTIGPYGCVDAWQGQGSQGFVFEPGIPFGPASARIRIVGAVPAVEQFPVSPQTEYAGANIHISRLKSTGTGSCPGCNAQVCLYISYLELDEPAPAPPVISSDSGGHEFVTLNYMNPSAPPCPGAVPTRRPTWGAVKALYR